MARVAGDYAPHEGDLFAVGRPCTKIVAFTGRCELPLLAAVGVHDKNFGLQKLASLTRLVISLKGYLCAVRRPNGKDTALIGRGQCQPNPVAAIRIHRVDISAADKGYSAVCHGSC